MQVGTRRARTWFHGRSSDGDVRPDDRIALVDEALFAAHSAAGLNVVIQCVWIYEHAIDLDGLRRFHHNLGCGLLARRIERSPLPFARHRWVADEGPPEIDVAEFARPRAELTDWADERSQLPIDAERGPGWHLGVLPLTDGCTAVSLVHSHYLIDGLGLAQVVVEAALGKTRDLGHLPPRSRTRLRAVGQDARQTARDVPAVARAVVMAAKLARRQARSKDRAARSPQSRPDPLAIKGDRGDAHDDVVVPATWIRVDLDDWDARAEALGGTGSTLIAAFAAKLGERMGRRHPGDGAVTLHLPISERTEGDVRANAMSIATVRVDPTQVSTDLRDVRAAIKQALRTLRETPDESLQVRSLIPFLPKRTLKRMADAGFTDPDRPMLCSNLGDFNPLVCRLDGNDGELAMTRATGQRVSRQWLERAGGQITLQSWRTGGTKIYITVNAYLPGAENSKVTLRELAAHTLAEFGLTGEIE